jgi:ABC-type transport system involved in multi-copper enzyme maturation permease subunit
MFSFYLYRCRGGMELKMFRLLRSEAKKIFTLRNVIVCIFGLLFVCFICAFIENNIIENSNTSTGISNQHQFMEFNITFVLVKVLFPIFIAFITAVIITGEYESGLMKNFLTNGIKRGRYLFCKIIIANICAVLTALMIMFSLSLAYAVLWRTSFNISLQTVILYLAAGVSAIPIIAALSFISVLSDNFMKTIFISSGGVFLSLSLDSVIGENIITPTSFLSFIKPENSLFAVIYSIPYVIIAILIFKRKNIWL